MGPRPNIRLTSPERRRLERIRRQAPSAKAYKRASVILLSADRRTAKDISNLIGYSLESVYAIRRRWDQLKFAGLEDLASPVRPPKITDEYVELLRYSIWQQPARFGYAFTTWSSARMAEHLKGLTGISITPDYLSYVLRRLGYSFKKPKHTLKNICDPKEYKRGKRVLRTLKKGP